MGSRFSALLFVLAAAGCEGKGGDAAPAGSASASATSSSAAAPALGPKVDALARAAVPCKAYDTSIDSSCPAMKAWSEARDDFSEGRADAALVALLADPDEKVRYLGAYKLNQYGKAFRTDKALASAVVTAAEKEQSKLVGYELGSTVGRLVARETGTFDRVKALVLRRDGPDVRRGIVFNMLFNNQDDEPTFALVRAATKDPDGGVALAALQSFWTGGTHQGDATCQVYADHTDDPTDDMASEACNYLAWFGRCSARYDALLDSLEKRVKAGSVTSISYVMAARHVCEDVKATDAQRKRGAAIGRAVARKKDGKSWIRSAALDTVLKCDAGDGGRAFVGTFAKDPEKSLADKAVELLARK